MKIFDAKSWAYVGFDLKWIKGFCFEFFHRNVNNSFRTDFYSLNWSGNWMWSNFELNWNWIGIECTFRTNPYTDWAQVALNLDFYYFFSLFRNDIHSYYLVRGAFWKAEYPIFIFKWRSSFCDICVLDANVCQNVSQIFMRRTVVLIRKHQSVVFFFNGMNRFIRFWISIILLRFILFFFLLLLWRIKLP